MMVSESVEGAIHRPKHAPRPYASRWSTRIGPTGWNREWFVSIVFGIVAFFALRRLLDYSTQFLAILLLLVDRIFHGPVDLGH